MMSHPERAESQPSQVSLEDILRLKRSERPSPEFWSRFEQELRAKQLAAIVEKRPWWLTLHLPVVARSLSRLQVPMGAAAVLALSFVVVREYRPDSSTFNVATPSPAIQPVVVASPALSNAVAGSAVGSATAINTIARNGASAHVGIVSATTSASGRVSAEAADLPTAEPAAVGPGGLMAMIPWAPQAVAAPQTGESLALGELSQVHFSSAVNPGRDHDFEGRVEVQPVVMPVARNADMAIASTVPMPPAASPREVRRNHILSSLAGADNASDADPTRLVQVREVLASALDDDRIYDSVRRLGMGGDRLTLKF